MINISSTKFFTGYYFYKLGVYIDQTPKGMQH